MTDSATQDHVSPRKPAAAGKTGGSEVTAFDFRHPVRIDRSERALLEGVCGRFAGLMQAYLSSRLRVTTDVVLTGVEQATFAEFIFSLGTPCAAAVMDVNGKGHYHAVIDLGTEFGFYVIDRLFGGGGDGADPKRPMTALEQTVLKGVAERLVENFGKAWEDDIPAAPTYQGFEANPEELTVAGRDESVLVATFDIRSDQFSGAISLCIPVHAVEGMLQERPRRTVKAQVVPEAERLAVRKQVEAILQTAQLEVRARFPLFKLQAGEIARLKPGRVIHTAHHLEIPIEVMVSGRRHFLGTMGQIHRNLGVRVTRSVHEQPGGAGASPRIPRGKVL